MQTTVLDANEFGSCEFMSSGCLLEWHQKYSNVLSVESSHYNLMLEKCVSDIDFFRTEDLKCHGDCCAADVNLVW